MTETITTDTVQEALAALAAGDEAPEIDVPEDGPVDLPGGFVRALGDEATEEVTTAWVRELTGVDEERIAKARMKGSPTAFLSAILEGGVSKIGDAPGSLKEIKQLLNGDVDYLLLEISRATYGDELEYENFICQNCGEPVSFTLSKSDDIPVHHLNSPEDNTFTVDLRNGRHAEVRYPTWSEQLAMEKAVTAAEKNTILLSHCVLEITDKDGGSYQVTLPKHVKNLGVKDRMDILSKIADKAPGPRYDEVTFTHNECGEEIKVAVTFQDLFLGL